MKEKRKITIIPFGGLANRIRVIASALELKKKYDLNAEIIWISRPELNCPFHELFTELEGVKLRSVSNNIFWRILIMISSKWNFKYLFYIFNILTDRFIENRMSMGYFDADSKLIEDKLSSDRKNNLTIITCHKIFNFPTISFKDFAPTKLIENKVTSFIEINDLSKGFTSFHIRQTDNIESIKNSPLYLFERRIEECIANKENIVICSDSDFVLNSLKNKFGPRIICSNSSKNRDNINGIQDALFELLVLSKSKQIYASQGSSFSLLAHEFGYNEFEIIKK